MEKEKQDLLHAIEEQWERMTLPELWDLYRELYEERDIRELLHSRFLDDVTDGEAEELGFLLATMKDLEERTRQGR